MVTWSNMDLALLQHACNMTSTLKYSNLVLLLSLQCPGDGVPGADAEETRVPPALEGPPGEAPRGAAHVPQPAASGLPSD
jgi:hypothetical protein